MPSPFVPAKRPENADLPIATRAIEQWQIAHENLGIVPATSTVLSTNISYLSESLTANGALSADVGHDAGLDINVFIPNLRGRQIEFFLSIPGFIYDIDPGANALFTARLIVGSGSIIAASSSSFITGLPRAGGVYMTASLPNDSSLMVAGTTVNARVFVLSTNTSQAYGTYGAISAPMILGARVV